MKTMVEQKLDRDDTYDHELEKAVEVMHQHQQFILTTHLNPDGDGLGCESALYLALTGMGKTVRIVNAHPIPDLYYFLPQHSQFEVGQIEATPQDVIIYLECPDEKRSGEVIKNSEQAAHIINIDHHVFNARYGSINMIDPTASAAGEQIWDLLSALNCSRDNRMAIGIYTAIATDTGHFKYAGVTSRTHQIIGELLELGVQPSYMNEQLYERVPAEALNLLARALCTVEYNQDKSVGWFHITQAMLRESGAKQNQTENFVNYVRAVDGVQVAIFFMETSDGKVKLSFRSKGGVDVSAIAHQLGGGGHQRAAGTLLTGGLNEVKEKVLSVVFGRINNKEE
jgi:phosphoesterase RecJ-like protein